MKFFKEEFPEFSLVKKIDSKTKLFQYLPFPLTTSCHNYQVFLKYLLYRCSVKMLAISRPRRLPM